ncbi:MAG: DUF1822 family protein [Leptolyngbyaceae cyanobacterium RU_5_1]|nr:DUF1822 family protein [Leptolyngbyaceae cyanobacterium RU_5_1]
MNWLDRLCERRLDGQHSDERQNEQVQEPSLSERMQVGANLSQWLQGMFETGWQAIADLLGPEPDLAFSFRREDEAEPFIQRVKRIQLSAELPSVMLVVRLETTADDRRQIWVQVLPWQGSAYLPAGLSLVLLSVSGEVIQSVRAGSQSNYIQLRRFKCALGTQFRLQIAVADASVTEDFVV